MTVLRAQIVVRRGDFLLDASLTLAKGEVLAVLGPNGSGKSTLLAAIAGLVALDSGEIELADRALSARSGSRRLHLPPSRRSIGLLGQEPMLFPHLSVVENVAFGPIAQGVHRAAACRAAAHWLEAVDLSGLDERRPAELSGGQQQRVAIARALAARPAMLLMDEPLAALDVQTAGSLREMLRRHLATAGLPAIVVTHDVVDAIALADRVAIMHDGRIIDVGATSRVLGRPASRFAAALLGVNMVHGTITSEHALRLADGRLMTGDGIRLPTGTAASAVFAPGAVRLGSGAPPPGGVNTWTGTVAGLERGTSGIILRMTEGAIAAELPPGEVLQRGIAPGSTVRMTIDPAAVTIYPTPTQTQTAADPEPRGLTGRAAPRRRRR